MLAPRRLPAAWTAHRSRRATAKTNRAQKRLDEQQLAKGRRAARKRRRAMALTRCRPYSLATLAAVSLSAAGFCTGLIWGLGVGLVAGFSVVGLVSVWLTWVYGTAE